MAPLFTTYTELPRTLPPQLWWAARGFGLLVTAGIVTGAFVRPRYALTGFWSVFVPLAPLLFLTVPGLWRNLCPMATLNQLPRTVSITRGLALPDGVSRVAPLVSLGLFLAIVPLRKVWLEQNGAALGAFLTSVLAVAFAGGLLFKGKSGWCSSFCPMLSVERFYNLAPFVVVANSHCRPCVGCTRNCYDFNPTAAQLADLHHDDVRWTLYRRLFAGMLPWLVVGLNTTPVVTAVTPAAVAGVYGRLLLLCAAGVGCFMAIEAVSGLSGFKVQLLHVCAAAGLFYWYVTPVALSTFGVHSVVATGSAWAVAAVGMLVWLVRAWPREQAFLRSAFAPAGAAAESLLDAAGAARAGQVQVSFAGGPTVMAPQGETLLAVAEGNGVKIEAGCRMGMCGSDPVRILEGMENLTPAKGAERSTLHRLGAGTDWRMACVARLQGPARLSLDLSAPAEDELSACPPERAFAVDPGVRRVVVIGTGAAGITAVNELRRLHPEGALTILGDEPYDFYNRMSIGKLVSESTSIHNLYILPRNWAESRRIRSLVGTAPAEVRCAEQVVITSDGDRLPYDRLILATGGRATLPPVQGLDLPGSFVLRTLDDGVAIQQHLRRERCRSAVVIGGGLLGLEAAYSMSQLGVRVFVLDRNPWPLSRQLDHIAGALLWQLVHDLGIEVLINTVARRLIAGPGGQLAAVELSGGRTLPVQASLATAGVSPNIELAENAGLRIGRGILVDDRMATSNPDIFAIGDVAEHRGRNYGLWPAAVETARIAAVNCLGGDLRYERGVPSCTLKVAAVDMLSVGEIFACGEGSEEIRLQDQGARRYRKLVIIDDEVRGGMLIGHPELADPVATAVAERFCVDGCVDALRAGDWSALPA